MSDPQSPYDPSLMWRPMMDAWAKAINQSGASEETAKAMLEQMNRYMEASTPMQQQMEKMFEQSLRQMNMPTRGELASLSERLTNIEMRLDDQDAKLDDVLKELKAVRVLLGEKKTTKKTQRNL